MYPVNLSNVKKGDYFTLKNVENPEPKDIYVKGEYERSSKCYSCYKYEDVNHERFFKANKVVYVL